MSVSVNACDICGVTRTHKPLALLTLPATNASRITKPLLHRAVQYETASLPGFLDELVVLQLR